MKKILLLAGIVLLAGGVYMVFPKNNLSAPASSPTPSPTNKSYTLEEVAAHAGRESCWLAIEGKVYDVTSFVQGGFHPGKEAILQGCGKDATELFNTRPMGSGTAHSERARKMLPKYYIGELLK